MSSERETGYMELPTSEGFQSEPAADPNPRTWTRTRILTLTGLAAAQYFSYTSVYILSSFYPPLAEEKHVSGIEIGLVIGIIQGVFTFAAYSFVQITHLVTPARQVTLGLVVTGVCTVVFGFLDKIEDGTPFFAACLCVRILQGIGIAATDLCVLMIANEVTPHNLLGTVVGILEFSLAAAIAVAPAIGGLLFEVGGFYLPFVVSGLTTVVAAAFCYLVLPTPDVSNKQDLRLILKHSVSIDMMVYITQFVLGGGFAGFFAGIIEPHLRQRAATAVTVIGCCLSAVGFVLFGPFPYLPIKLSLPLVCGSLVLCGIGISAVLIAVYTTAKEYLASTCDTEELANTVLASSYPSTYNIG